MRVVRTSEPSFEEAFRAIQGRGKVFDPELWQRVAVIVEDVSRRGDEALFEYTEKYDRHRIDAGSVEISKTELAAAAARVSGDDRAILELSAARIKNFHEKQIMNDWVSVEEEGVELEKDRKSVV